MYYLTQKCENSYTVLGKKSDHPCSVCCKASYKNMTITNRLVKNLLVNTTLKFCLGGRLHTEIVPKFKLLNTITI